MDIRKYSIMAAVLFLIFVPLTAGADIVHLKNGKDLMVERAWQESDQVCFILQGLKASIPQSKVARIESTGDVPGKTAAPGNNNSANIKESKPHPAGDMLTIKMDKAPKFVSAAQSQPLPKNKTLILCKDGFNGLKWGARLFSLKGLEQKTTDSGLHDVIEYVRPADVLKLGDADLTTVIYAFWKDQLYTVTIWTQGVANYSALRDAVFNQFGKGIQIEGAEERYLWSGDLSDVMLKYEDESQYGMLWMRSRDLERKLKLAKINSPTSYLRWMKSRK